MIERIILKNLVSNEKYLRFTLPFLQEEYFAELPERIVFRIIRDYFDKYGKLPDRSALLIEIDKQDEIDTRVAKIASTIVEEFDGELSDEKWLIDATEEYCQDRALVIALTKSIAILDKKESKAIRGNIPAMLQQALAVSFQSDLGHDYLRDALDRYDYFHHREAKIPFKLSAFNKITRNGLSRKTLSIILAGTGVGKSLFMCNFAADNLLDGFNVLYITLEMAEQKIAERIDANLLNMPISELHVLPRDVYEKKINRIKEKVKGRLVIEEYPTSQANVNHFRHLLNELKTKENFVPDIIYVDYINICASSRVKMSHGVNSYTYIKNIAEELRGLACEYNVAMVSATQTTRSGYSNMDPGLEDTSESFGLPATADFMFAVSVDENLQQLNQMAVKQLKNRYEDLGIMRRFIVGVDRPKFRLYDIEDGGQIETFGTRPSPSPQAVTREVFENFIK